MAPSGTGIAACDLPLVGVRYGTLLLRVLLLSILFLPLTQPPTLTQQPRSTVLATPHTCTPTQHNTSQQQQLCQLADRSLPHPHPRIRYGHRGESLANLSEVATVTLVTRHASEEQVLVNRVAGVSQTSHSGANVSPPQHQHTVSPQRAARVCHHSATQARACWLLFNAFADTSAVEPQRYSSTCKEHVRLHSCEAQGAESAARVCVHGGHAAAPWYCLVAQLSSPCGISL